MSLSQIQSDTPAVTAREIEAGLAAAHAARSAAFRDIVGQIGRALAGSVSLRRHSVPRHAPSACAQC